MAVAAATVSTSAVAAPTWEAGAPLPSARSQIAATVDSRGLVHIFGGYGDINDSAEHDVLQPDGGWTLAAPMPLAERAGAAATGNDGVLYYLGGYDDVADGELGTAYAFNLDGGWSQLPDMPFVAGWQTRADVGADGKIYVFGGEGDEIDDAGADLNNVNSKTQIYDPKTGTWTEGAPMPARRLYHAALRGSDGLFYVIAGGDENYDAQFTVFVYDPVANTWKDGPPLAFADFDGGAAVTDAGDGGLGIPLVAFGAAATPDRSYFVIVGGSTSNGNDDAPYYSDLFMFDVAAQKWSTFGTLSSPRRELAAAMTSCTLHVLGGSNGTKLDTNETATFAIGPDTDADGLPDACDPDDDNDGTPDAEDCSPKDPSIHPGATETCNGKDDDCNGVVDDPPVCQDGGGSRDGGGLADASVIPREGGSGGGDGGSADNGGSDSGGCSCRVGAGDDAGSFAIFGIAAVGFALTSRRNKKRNRRGAA